MTRSRMWNAGTAVVVVLILLAGWFLAIAPQRSAAAESRTAAESAADQNLITERKIAALKLAQKDLPAQIAKIEDIRKQLPEQPAQPALLRQLAKIVENSGAEVFGISPTPIEPLEGVEGVRVVTINVKGRGTYEMLGLFLDQIELNKRAMVVTTLAMEPATPREGEKASDVVGLLALDIGVRVFMSDPGATAPADGAGAPGAAGTPDTPVAPSTTTPAN